MATYDPQNIVVVFAAVPLTSGFAADEFLTIEQTEDSYTVQVGSTGEVCRSRNNNRSGLAKVSLQGSSLLNDAMSTIMELDSLLNAGTGPFMMKDFNSLGLSVAPDAWIKKPPAYSFGGTELPAREWELALSSVDSFIGGQLA